MMQSAAVGVVRGSLRLRDRSPHKPSGMAERFPFRSFQTSPECNHETVRSWWNRFGPAFACEIRGRRVAAMARGRGLPEDQRGDALPLCRAVELAGERLGSSFTKTHAIVLAEWRGLLTG